MNTNAFQLPASRPPRTVPVTAANSQCDAAETTKSDSLVCDQVIFTSIRTPTGEGYRIIAASKNVRTDEKQVITRLSPSHDSLCDENAPESTNSGAFGSIRAAAMYSLPSSRICLAASMLAGDEQTGRGGKRIYTLNLIFSAEDLGAFDFNPFAILRAVATTEHATPQLKPPQVLPAIELAPSHIGAFGDAGSLSPNARRQILSNILLQKECLVPISEGWINCAEAMLLGCPGPLRAKVSFSAGLKYSTTRRHRLEVLSLDATAKARLASSKMHCIDPANTEISSENAWIDFVDRHWNCGDLPTLARRTSRKFKSCVPESLTRVANLYNQIDALESHPTERILANATEMLDPVADPVEGEIRNEFTDKAKSVLQSRVRQLSPQEFSSIWPRLLGMVRSASPRSQFASALIEPALRGLVARDPLVGTKNAVEIVRIPSTAALLTPSFQDYLYQKFAEQWSQLDQPKRDEAARSLRNSLQGSTHPLATRLVAIIAPQAPGK